MATSIGVKLGIDGEAEYKKQIKEIINETKTLDKQLEAVKSSFDGQTNSMEQNAKETELLQKKAAKLTDEVELMKTMVEQSAEKYGENSAECTKWEGSLAAAQTQLNKTNSEIEKHEQAAAEANSAVGQLTTVIDEQETELGELKTAYTNAVLEFGEGSAEAQALAGQIEDLSGDLNENKEKLEAAQAATEELTNQFSGASEEAGGSKTALEELTSTITDQQTELTSLKDEYVNAVLQFGEGSAEAQALAEQIGELTTELSDNQEKLDEAKTAAEDLVTQFTAAAEETDNTKSAFEELTDTISSQESELSDLRDEYINAVLEFGEGSAEAENLAGQMSTLSDNLAVNKQRLDEAAQSVNNLSAPLNDTAAATTGLGDAAIDAIGGQFMPMFSEMNSLIENAGTAGMIGGIVSVLVELGEQAIDTSTRYQEAMNAIQMATLTGGANLDDMNDIAREVYYSMSDTDLSIDSVANTVGALNTRLGYQNESLEEATRAVSTYAAVTGEDGARAVNSLVDTMKLWGMVTDDDTQTIRNMKKIMDQLIVAQSMADVSTGELLDSVTKQAGAWQSLGYDLDDAIAIMLSYADAGGNISDITTAVFNAVKNLSGETDDMRGAWEDAIVVLSESTDRFSSLDVEIGDTGKTISDVFGAKKAGQMIDVFKDGKVQSDAFSEALKGASGTTDSLYESTRTAADMTDKWLGSFDNFFDSFAENNILIQAFRGNLGKLTDKWTDQIETIKNAGKASNDTSTTTENNLAMLSDDLWDFGKVGSDVERDISNNFKNIASVVSQPMQATITVPQIAYYATGSGDNKQIRSSVWYETYARGYDEAMILNSPTIFGARGDNLLVGGDRPGSEVVVGEAHLLDMFEQVVSKNSSSGLVEGLYSLLNAYLPVIAEQKDIYLDGDTLVGSTAPGMYNALENISIKKSRGVL